MARAAAQEVIEQHAEHVHVGAVTCEMRGRERGVDERPRVVEAPQVWPSLGVYDNGVDADGQMQVLWAIQKYCDTQGFPKINDEYLVQAMFRAMYKFDLAEPGAFDLWKEDESEANEKGKMKSVIQTMDWFTWLEEDDDDEEEEEYEEEEE